MLKGLYHQTNYQLIEAINMHVATNIQRGNSTFTFKTRFSLTNLKGSFNLLLSSKLISLMMNDAAIKHQYLLSGYRNTFFVSC